MRISDWSSDVCSSDLVDQPVHRSEGLGDEIEQRAGRLLLLRAETAPVETVVPDLADLIEQPPGAIGSSKLDQFHERLALQRGIGRDQFVRLDDIGVVMLAVMIVERLR